MKSNLTLVLIINLGILFFSFLIFITKGINSDALNWRFYASLMAVIVFSIFSILIVKEIKKQKQL